MFVTTGFLSSDVSSPRSSLGSFLREAFPNIRPIQSEYKASAGALRVESAGRSASDVGAGVDLAFRIMLEPDHLPAQAHGLFPFNESYRDVVVALRDIVATDGAEPEQRSRAIAFKQGAVKHVYFVAETKGSLSSLELRPAEKAKIDCARKLFMKLNEVAGTPGIKYDVVRSYDDLLQLVGA